MIKKIYLFMYLILFLLPQSSLCMQANLKDPKYLELKKQLSEDIVNKKSFDEITDRVENIKNYLFTKFVPNRFDIKQKRNYQDNVQSIYLNDLFNEPQGNSILDEASKNKNIDILYTIFKELNPDVREIDFLNFLNNNLIPTINPDKDLSYLEEKQKLLEAVKQGDSKLGEELLKFEAFLKKQFIPENEIIPGIYTYFKTSILPIYIQNLYPNLLKASLDNENYNAIYMMLNYLAGNIQIFQQLIIKKVPIISQLLKLDNQIIYDELNYLIILNMYSYKSSHELFVEFLNDLKNNGIEANRLDDNIIKFLAYSKLPLQAWLKPLQTDGFLKNFDPEVYKQYTSIFSLPSFIDQYGIENINLASKLSELNDKFINEKDIKGNNLLINITAEADIGTKLINLIEKLIKNYNADINQRGQAGLTVLMNLAKNISIQSESELIKYLISKGADLHAKDISGKTALDYAIEAKQSSEIIKLLKHTKAVSIENYINALSDLSSILNSLSLKI